MATHNDFKEYIENIKLILQFYGLEKLDWYYYCKNKGITTNIENENGVK